MSNIETMESQYLGHLADLIEFGERKGDRTGTGTLSLFGHQMRADLRQGFPLLTTKKVFLKGIIHELLWLLSGSTNIGYLQEHGVYIWDEWASEKGDLGPVYGEQWRNYDGVDQIGQVMQLLTNDPDSRRIIVSAWNVGQLEDMALMPCHTLFQFNTVEMTDQERIKWANASGNHRHLNFNDFDHGGVPKRYLDCQLYQRSGDMFLGVPFNIASYALLTMMIAQQVNMVPRHFVHTLGDSHLYLNHIEQAKEQLSRAPCNVPKMQISARAADIFDYKYEDFQLVGYEPHSAITAEVAV